MYFRGEQHEENFEWELRTRPEMSNSDISVLYLLTADDKLWEQIQDAVTPRHCFFEDMRPKHLSLSGYTFFRLARDIYENRCTMAMTELVHPQILPPKDFLVLSTALFMCGYGPAAADRLKIKG